MDRTTPLLEYIEGREFDAASRKAALARMLTLTESALTAHGIGLDTVAGRIMRLVVRVAGLGVLRRSRDEIASDPDVECESRSVPRAIKRLEATGMLRRGIYTTDQRVSGLVLQVDFSAISSASEQAPTVAEHWSHSEGNQTAVSGVAGGVTATVTDTVTATVATPVTGGVTTGVASGVTTGVTKSNHTIYPSSPISLIPSSSSSLGAQQLAEEDDDEGNSEPTLEEIGRAACKLRDAARKRSPRRAEEAREELWQVAYIGLKLEGPKLIDYWIRAAHRKYPDDYPDYFVRCARATCEDRQKNINLLCISTPKLAKPQSTKIDRSIVNAPENKLVDRSKGVTPEERRLIASF